jgi:predicted Fe-Mo cluster-binding NifX family protein
MMKIVVPVAEGRLTQHFGHCSGFDSFDIADDGTAVTKKASIVAPPREPGLLPKFLAGNDMTRIVAGGMGSRARDLFAERDITHTSARHPKKPEKSSTSVLRAP